MIRTEGLMGLQADRLSTVLLVRAFDEIPMTPDQMSHACGVDRATFDGYFAKPDTMPLSCRLALAAFLLHLAGADAQREALARELAVATRREIMAAGAAMRRDVVGKPLDEVRRRANAYFAALAPPGYQQTAADIATKKGMTEEALLLAFSASEA